MAFTERDSKLTLFRAKRQAAVIAADGRDDGLENGTTIQLAAAESLMVCPACKGSLRRENGDDACINCSSRYPVVDEIPKLVANPRHVDHDELEHHIGCDGKRRQAKFFDEYSAADFEVRRPHDGPRLYAWLLGEKFRRSFTPIEPLPRSATALVVCGGSGMDAEFLARRGIRVITSDISLGAAKRAAERCRRYGLAVLSIVADVEQLPFADRSIDVVYVHDGLHHLDDPMKGLAEMMRVASHGICLNEPARAAFTRLAVRFRLAKEYEEAGNRVARLGLDEVAHELLANKFYLVNAERYAMYYRHQPGLFSKLLSGPGLFQASTLLWRLVNAVIGRFGNKLAMTGVRS